MARRWAGSSTVTKRQGWLSPTEGARHASWIRRSKVPGGNGSRRKRRTSRRQTSRSRKRARKASSKSIGLLVAAMEPWICAFMLRPSTPSPNHHIAHARPNAPPLSASHNIIPADLPPPTHTTPHLPGSPRRPRDTAGLAPHLPDGYPPQRCERGRHERDRVNARGGPESDAKRDHADKHGGNRARARRRADADG